MNENGRLDDEHDFSHMRITITASRQKSANICIGEYKKTRINSAFSCEKHEDIFYTLISLFFHITDDYKQLIFICKFLRFAAR
jgi:hypothetical protein